MKKYEFVKKSLDEYELHYHSKKIDTDGKIISEEDKIIPFTRDINLMKKVQSVPSNARFKMMEYLTKIGKTKKDLIVETKNEDGTTTIDETNYLEFEKSFLIQEEYNLGQSILEDTFKLSAKDLVTELNLNTEEEVKFGEELRDILLSDDTDKIPSNPQSKKS